MSGFPHAEPLVVRPVDRGFGLVEVEWAQKDVEHTLIVAARLSPVGARDLAAKLLAAANRIEGTPPGEQPCEGPNRQDLQARIDSMLAASHVADAEDVTDWQRGFRACSDRVRQALSEVAW